MDTTYIEYTAEDLIAHKLQRGGLLVAKPKFDRDGTDLIALMEVADGSKFCRIQCKGRTLIKSDYSNVSIPKEYVKGAFFVFMYVDIGDIEPHIFCFSTDEIIDSWDLKINEKGKEIYYIGISKNAVLCQNNGSNFLKFSFTDDTISQIKRIINKSVSKDEIEMFKLLKQQQGLIDKNDEIHKLETIIKEIEHSEESLKHIKNSQKILEEQYATELSKLTSDLPKELARDISILVNSSLPVDEIMIQINNKIPDNIPKPILKDYITKIMFHE